MALVIITFLLWTRKSRNWVSNFTINYTFKKMRMLLWYFLSYFLPQKVRFSHDLAASVFGRIIPVLRQEKERKVSKVSKVSIIEPRHPSSSFSRAIIIIISPFTFSWPQFKPWTLENEWNESLNCFRIQTISSDCCCCLFLIIILNMSQIWI